MTASASICGRVFDAIAARAQQYYFRELRAMPELRGIEDQQLRNALVGLQVNGRLLKTGPHGHHQYFINPVQPAARTAAARTTTRVLRDVRHTFHATGPALAPAWPAPRGGRRMDGSPYARICA